MANLLQLSGTSTLRPIEFGKYILRPQTPVELFFKTHLYTFLFAIFLPCSCLQSVANLKYSAFNKQRNEQYTHNYNLSYR